MREGSADETKNVQNGETMLKQNRQNYKRPKTRQQYNLARQHQYSLTEVKAQKSFAADRHIRKKTALRFNLADLAENSKKLQKKLSKLTISENQSLKI